MKQIVKVIDKNKNELIKSFVCNSTKEAIKFKRDLYRLLVWTMHLDIDFRISPYEKALSANHVSSAKTDNITRELNNIKNENKMLKARLTAIEEMKNTTHAELKPINNDHAIVKNKTKTKK